MYVAANASELFYMVHLANIEHFLPFILNIKFYMHVNSPAWAGENQLKCEKVCFLSKMSGINSRWVIFNL